MLEVIKKNLLWFAIGLGMLGVIMCILSLTGQPLLFFIGIILALPSIAFLIYEVFFDKNKPDIKLPFGIKRAAAKNGRIIDVIDSKEELLTDDPNQDLEPLYNGYASPKEIDKELAVLAASDDEVTAKAASAALEAREEAIAEMQTYPAPEEKPKNALTAVIGNITKRFSRDATPAGPDVWKTAQDELLRKREETAEAETPPAPEAAAEVVPEVPKEKQEQKEKPENFPNDFNDFAADDADQAEVIEMPKREEPAEQPAAEPQGEYVQGDYVLTEKPIPANAKVRVLVETEEAAAKRKTKIEEKKSLLSQGNLERFLKNYFIETATCFFMDRDGYKDSRGIAPYNKIVIKASEEPGKHDIVEYSMNATSGKLYKFCTYLPDMERFLTHEVLYRDFTASIESGTSLARTSEKLHTLYRKFYKKDFILNLSNREDFDNVVILVFNNYILDNDNFKDVFTRVPFVIPDAFNEENIVSYLASQDLEDKFAEKFPTYTDIGIPTVWDAMYICFINSVKSKLSPAQLESAILKDHKRIVKALKSASKKRNKVKKSA